jgi:hypothetical protein
MGIGICRGCGAEDAVVGPSAICPSCSKKYAYIAPGLPPGNTPIVTAEEQLRTVLREDQPWPLRDVLRRLVRGADHLLNDHNCDEQGHEELMAARDAAIEILRGL